MARPERESSKEKIRKQGLHPLEPGICLWELWDRGLGTILWTEHWVPCVVPEWGAQRRAGSSLGGQKPSRSSGAKAACGMARVLGG